MSIFVYIQRRTDRTDCFIPHACVHGRGDFIHSSILQCLLQLNSPTVYIVMLTEGSGTMVNWMLACTLPLPPSFTPSLSPSLFLSLPFPTSYTCKHTAYIATACTNAMQLLADTDFQCMHPVTFLVAICSKPSGVPCMYV